MATVDATITNLRLEGQALAFTLAVTGDEGGQAWAMMMVYDAAGTERGQTELGTMSAGQSWDALLDLPVSNLDDGDYGAWVYVTTSTADGDGGPSVEQGISFLVGRGHVYPSGEQADKRTFQIPPTLSPLRLEGTWIVFDMTNNDGSDLEVSHQFTISLDDADYIETFRGEELLRAGATQQGHYLLPDNLADGKYTTWVTAQYQGSDLPDAAIMNIQVDGGVITVIPTP